MQPKSTTAASGVSPGLHLLLGRDILLEERVHCLRARAILMCVPPRWIERARARPRAARG
eukprot:4223184-Pleurochrysis_carterae.AAC.1